MQNRIVFERAAPSPDWLAAPASHHHPSEVLADPDLTVAERRAILASWASDAHAVEDAPQLRQLENGARAPVSDILSALKALDDEAPARAPRTTLPGPSVAGVSEVSH
jgi:hypothetical protein